MVTTCRLPGMNEKGKRNMTVTNYEGGKELPPLTLSAKDRVLIGDGEACYRLLCCALVEAHYFAEIALGDERAAVYLGTGERARALYTVLVRGSVTPCTLRDVVEDLQKTDTVLPFLNQQIKK